MQHKLAAGWTWLSGLDGGLLSDAAWRRRHWVVAGLATLNGVVVVVLAVAAKHGTGLWPLTIVLAAALVCAWFPSSHRRPRELAVVVAFLACAAIENRYVGNLSSLAAAYILLVAVYQDWLPLVVGVAATLVLPAVAVVDPASLNQWKSFQAEDAETGAFLRFLGLVVAGGAAVLVWRANGVAARDGVSGLPTRTLAERRLTTALGNERRPAVLVCDVDAFHLVADEVTRAESDSLIRAVGRRLRHAVRPRADMVAASLGACYIVMRLRDTDAEQATELARQLCAAVAREPFRLGDAAIPMTISVGIAIAEPGDEPSDLIAAATREMRNAKWGGAMAISVASHDQVGPSTRPSGPITAELRQAVQRGELIMYYQPLVDLRTGSIVGAEALVRWQHPTRGVLGPGEFVPYGEAHPWLNAALGRAITEMVLEQTDEWTREFPDAIPSGIAVNIAPTRLKDPALHDELIEMLAATELDPNRIVLELTEGALMDFEGDAPGALAALSQIGVRIALDDFGTGHSSLAHLRDFPLHEIKVDQSFIAHVTDSGPDRAVVRAVLAIAYEFGAVVVVEGVEREDQREVVLELGGDGIIGQGYLFGRPMPAADFTALLRAAQPLAPAIT